MDLPGSWPWTSLSSTWLGPPTSSSIQLSNSLISPVSSSQNFLWLTVLVNNYVLYKISCHWFLIWQLQLNMLFSFAGNEAPSMPFFSHYSLFFSSFITKFLCIIFYVGNLFTIIHVHFFTLLITTVSFLLVFSNVWLGSMWSNVLII